jgi:hypothetical protein
MTPGKRLKKAHRTYNKKSPVKASLKEYAANQIKHKTELKDVAETWLLSKKL